MTSSGWFGNDGWWLHLTGDDPDSAQFASAHESHHKQLQDSTSYGCLTRVLAELGQEAPLSRFDAVAAQLTVASEHVQEAFASWLPAAALGWSRDRLLDAYPAYERYFDAMAGIVGGLSSPYLRFHAAHAVGRACMQTTAIDEALGVGLDKFTLADLRHRDLPNARFATLRRDQPDWTEVSNDLALKAVSDGTLRLLIEAPDLRADLFAPALADVWQLVNETLYDLVARQLQRTGLLTIDHDGHLDRTPCLLAEARRLASRPLDLESGGPRRASEAPSVVLRNIEAEGFSVAPPLSARVLPTGTDPKSLLADLADPHLFVTVRPTAALFANYVLAAGETPASAAGAFARRTVQQPDGSRLVELLDVTDAHTHVVECGHPVVVAAAMSQLPVSELSAWTTGTTLSTTVIVLDLPLGPHLDLWLARPGARFHYALIRTESFNRVVPFLVARVDVDGAASSPTLVRPLSHAAIRIHKATFDEYDPTGLRIVEGLGFLHGDHQVVSRCLAHLAGEEVRFGAVG